MRLEVLQPDDIERAVQACVEYASEIQEPYDMEYIRRTFHEVVGRYPITVAKDEHGNIIGMAAFVCVPHLYNPHLIQAKECIWHSSPKLGLKERVKVQYALLKIMTETCARKNIPFWISLPVSSAWIKRLEKDGFKSKYVLLVKE